MIVEALLACSTITWSVDTSGLHRPGRASAAVSRAVKEWADLTGTRWDWQPSGGQVSIVFRPTPPEWLAYAQSNVVVISPGIERWGANVLQRTAAHEIAHVLGLPHLAKPNSIVSDSGYIGAESVTPDDAAMARCPA